MWVRGQKSIAHTHTVTIYLETRCSETSPLTYQTVQCHNSDGHSVFAVDTSDPMHALRKKSKGLWFAEATLHESRVHGT
jgi:hypothetical protein